MAIWTRQFSRVFRSGLANVERNTATSIATLFVLTLTLLSVSFFGLGLSLVEISIESIEKKVDVSIYFDPFTPETQIMDAKAKIEDIPNVVEVSYQSKDASLEQLKLKYGENSSVAKSLEELSVNPLPPTLTARSNDPTKYEEIALQIEQDLKGYSVTEVSYQNAKRAIDRLTRISRILRIGGVIVAAIFLFIALMISVSSIRLAIMNRKREIEIMHLVGATRRFIRGPFLVEGVIFGVASSVITMFVIGIIYYFGAPRILLLFSGFDPSRLILLGAYWWVLLLVLMIGGCAIGLFASWIAIKRHLDRRS